MNLTKLKCFLEKESIFLYIYIGKEFLKMAKKSKTKTANINVNLDELVDEGKKLTEEVVAEETAKAAEVKKKLAEESAKETDTVNTQNTDVEEITHSELHVGIASPSTDEQEIVEKPSMAVETENIDDVIAECTGTTEEPKEEPHKTDRKKTWYEARAMRNDYFSW